MNPAFPQCGDLQSHQPRANPNLMHLESLPPLKAMAQWRYRSPQARSDCTVNSIASPIVIRAPSKRLTALIWSPSPVDLIGIGLPNPLK